VPQAAYPNPFNTGVRPGSLLTLVPVVGSLWRESVDGAGLFTSPVLQGDTFHKYSNYDFQATTSLMYLDGAGGGDCLWFDNCNVYTSGLVNNTSAQIQTTTGLRRLIFTDCTMDGGAAFHNRNIEDGNADLTVLRCQMYHFGNSSVEKNSCPGKFMDVRDSYFYESRGWQQADHIDGIQTDGNMGAVRILHNTVLVEPYGAADGDETYGPTSCINITAAFGPISGDVTIDSNWIAGGGYCMYCSTQGSVFTGHQIVSNNIFDRRYFPYLSPTYASMWGKESANNSVLYPTNVAPELATGGWFNNRWEDGTILTYAQATA
jgi:hypothetical protein